MTRRLQPGPSGADPLRPYASSSFGVISSWPSQKGHESSAPIVTDSRRKSVGRFRRSVEMITQRPVTGSLRSSDIECVPVNLDLRLARAHVHLHHVDAT